MKCHSRHLFPILMRAGFLTHELHKIHKMQTSLMLYRCWPVLFTLKLITFYFTTLPQKREGLKWTCKFLCISKKAFICQCFFCCLHMSFAFSFVITGKNGNVSKFFLSSINSYIVSLIFGRVVFFDKFFLCVCVF